MTMATKTSAPANKGIYDIAINAMFLYEETREHADCGDDMIIWPDDEHCDARDLAEYGHKSDDYLRVHIDSDAYDIVSCELKANQPVSNFSQHLLR